MNEHLATIIIAAIAGVFSLLTIIVQRGQDKIIHKIDEQTILIDREKKLKRQLGTFEKNLGDITRKTILLLLDFSQEMAKQLTCDNEKISKIIEETNKLKNEYNEITSEMNGLRREYDMVADLSESFQEAAKESAKHHGDRK